MCLSYGAFTEAYLRLCSGRLLQDDRHPAHRYGPSRTRKTATLLRQSLHPPPQRSRTSLSWRPFQPSLSSISSWQTSPPRRMSGLVSLDVMSHFVFDDAFGIKKKGTEIAGLHQYGMDALTNLETSGQLCGCIRSCQCHRYRRMMCSILWRRIRLVLENERE
jgi:hypothetical protein